MQEEVENRTVNLAVTTTRMTARAILSGIRTYLYYHNHNKVNDPYKHGKQSVKDLIWTSGTGFVVHLLCPFVYFCFLLCYNPRWKCINLLFIYRKEGKYEQKEIFAHSKLFYGMFNDSVIV